MQTPGEWLLAEYDRQPDFGRRYDYYLDADVFTSRQFFQVIDDHPENDCKSCAVTSGFQGPNSYHWCVDDIIPRV